MDLDRYIHPVVFVNTTTAHVDVPQLPIAVIPALIMEIVSVTDTAVAVERKFQQYKRAGVEAICLIYLPLRSAVMYQNGLRRVIPESGTIETDLLPGFRLKLADLFAAVPSAPPE